MNIQIQEIMEQVKKNGVDEDKTLVLTETDEGVQISKVKKNSDQLD